MNSNSFLQEVREKILERTFFVDFTVQSIYFVIKLFICILLYYFTLKVVKKILPIFKNSNADKIMDQSLKSFISSIFNIGLHAFLITICLLILGIKESSLLAFFGTLGIGVGLSLKDNLSNFSGGVIILIFEIYKVGDEVCIADHVGYVYQIDIFSTSIRTHNNDLVLVPNGKIVSDKIINYTKTPIRRLKFIVSINYSCDIDKAREVLEIMLRENPLVLKEPSVYSHVDEYADSSINIALKGWCINENYWTIYKETLNNIKPTLDSNNIEMPFPQMDVHMNIVKE